jgi:hypothetical protein
MSNFDLACSRLLVLRQIHSELIEQLEQLQSLREKLRTAERFSCGAPPDKILDLPSAVSLE